MKFHSTKDIHFEISKKCDFSLVSFSLLHLGYLQKFKKKKKKSKKDIEYGYEYRISKRLE